MNSIVHIIVELIFSQLFTAYANLHKLLLLLLKHILLLVLQY